MANSHSSYEHSSRIYTSKLYPVPAPNGSSVVISGTEKGLHITWNGGKPLYFTSRSEGPLVNGTSHNQATAPQVSEDPESDDEALFESDEEELDNDQPYPSIAQDLDLPLGTAVLHLAIPEIPLQANLRSGDNIPNILSHSIVVAAACSDGSSKIITLPLDPPSAASKRKKRLGAHICAVGAEDASAMVRGIALTWTSIGAADQTTTEENSHNTRSQSRSRTQAPNPELSLLVAIATSDLSGRLQIFKVPVHSAGGVARLPRHQKAPLQTQYLSAYPTRVSFNTAILPSNRHSQLLIADASGCLRVYDPLAPSNGGQRPSSADSQITQPTDQGAWLLTLNSSFHSLKDRTSANPGLAQRKKILDASWVCGGRGILALVEDGEWGVWDVDGTGPRPQKKGLSSPLDFVVRGFIGDAPETTSTGSAKTKSRSQLAPMTPNTRRVRQESLFSGPVAKSGVAARGGISAVPSTSSHGSVDDSIVLWYGNEMHHIPSLMNLWQRSASSSGQDTGSLYGPGLSRVEGFDLSGEMINCVTQLHPKEKVAPGLGKSVQKDFLITAEHRIIILEGANDIIPGRTLFNGEPEPESLVLRREQRLLDSGDLDIGGMDRMLDSMAGIEKTGGFGKGKRVGFAAH